MKRLSTISMIIFKILLIVVLGAIILFALVSFWGKLNYTKAKEARITNINLEAEDIYSYLSKYYKDHDIPPSECKVYSQEPTKIWEELLYRRINDYKTPYLGHWHINKHLDNLRS